VNFELSLVSFGSFLDQGIRVIFDLVKKGKFLEGMEEG
jgi:hypothetical protein